MSNQQQHIENVAISWLAKLNSDAVSEQQQRAFFTWLQQSPLHQAAYIKAEQLWQRGQVLQSFAVTERPANAKYSMPFARWTYGCCAILIIAAGLFFNTDFTTDKREISTTLGEQKQVTLDDGSQITLNANTRVTVTYSRKHRQVALAQGEAYFAVTENRQRPFDVTTAFGQVRVLGTHFAVKQGDSETWVTVEDGRVALGPLSADQNTFVETQVLLANQQNGIRLAQSGQAATSADAKIALAWRNKQLVYKRQPLATVIADLNRYYAANIQLGDPALQQREITAVIQLNDLPTTLKALCTPLKLRIEQTNNILTLHADSAQP